MKSSRNLSRHLLVLGILCSLSAVARGNTIVVGNHDLLPGTPGQVLSLTMSGSDAYAVIDLRLAINGGLAGGPVITHVFGDTDGNIPTANLVGSVWENGLAGIAINYPYGTTTNGSGLLTYVGMQTPGATSTTAAGVIASLTLDTTGVAPGVYSFSLTGHPNGPTQLFEGIDPETFNPIVTPLTIINGTIRVVPEPATALMAGMALIGLVAVATRRVRG